jgi:tRNA A-37 threonylcarbamoyl transferase component Bud32
MGSGESRCPRCGTEVPGNARFCPACGYATTRLTPGQVLDGKYEILDKLAEGGMGHVYRARHIHLDEIRIIKVTKPDPIGDGSESARFQEEARIATLVRHPNVAGLYDFSRLPDGSFYMVWEFIDGVTLEEWLRRHGPMPPRQALEVARQVLGGLSEIHAQGIVHRDLAPDNIMLREGPGGRLQAKIIDLGIAKRVASDAMQMTGTGMFVGKLKYCSPEQAGALSRGETLDGRSDLYSFGVVLYEMLTGHPPFEADTPEGYIGKHLHTAPPPLETSRLPAEVGPPLAAMLKRALEKNRDRRFRDAEEFRQTVTRLESAVADSTETAAAGPAPRASSGLWSMGSVAALLVLAAGVAGYALVHRSGGRPQAAPSAQPTAAPVASPTPEPPRGVDAVDASAARVADSGPGPARASSRSVADPSEAGVVRPAPTTVSEPAAATDQPEEASPDVPARMDGEATQRFRKFFRHWSTLPVERQAGQAMALARFANLFVATYPDDPLSGELRQRLPETLRRLAEQELDGGRRRLAVRFYEAYRALNFAAGNAGLDARFGGMPRP